MADADKRRGRMVIASRSCDACRMRKTKCTVGRLSLPPVSPDSQAHVPCERCSRLGLACTFELPTKSRGPKRKRIHQAALVTPEHNGAVQHDESILHGAKELASILATIEAPAAPPLSYPTDILCSRVLVKRILQDYLIYLYPLIPVVHRPSFRRDLIQDRDIRDDVFLGFILALCAVVIGIMPTRFELYRKTDPSIPFLSRAEMINRCYDMAMALRRPTYFDEVNFQKFAIAYLLGIAFFQLGEQNRSRMLECESMQLGRLLNLHRTTGAEDGLNCIEIQLRRKGLWLLFYGYVHSQLQNLRKEKLTFLDPIILESIDLEKLLPEEVDDELIMENMILPREDRNGASLIDGFNIHSKVFWAALVPYTLNKNAASGVTTCQCQRIKNTTANVVYLSERLQELKYMLDIVPGPLRQWAHAPDLAVVSDGDPTQLTDLHRSVVDLQFASMRANLHVTHLWLQSVLLDACEMGRAADDSTRKALWSDREEICRQLLHVLHGIPEAALEPNGLHLGFKLRDVAVGMLTCPYPEDTMAYKRASEYIKELTAVLSRLDRSERINTANSQSWIDTDKIKLSQINDITQFSDW